MIAQAICTSGCQSYGYCGGVYPTVVDTNDNDPLDVILPVLLLAIINRNGANGGLNNLNGGICDSGVSPVNNCYGNGGNGCNNCGCGNSCGACNSCNAGCNNICNNNGCPGPVATAITTGISNGCCGGCC